MMKRRLLSSLFSLFALTLAGCFALAEPEASSGTVVAPTLAPVVPTEEPVIEEEAAPTEEVSTAVPTETSGGPVVYEIDPSRSEARFTIEEVLRGSDKTVVGTSSNLAGQIAFAMNDPTATQVGEILINARDFATDDNFRNRAIANEILLTDTHEFVTFTPKEVIGLPDGAAIGESYDFQIVGDLTIIGQTQEVTFEVTVTPTSENELQGLATVTITYADFGVTVPLSQVVTAVAENVLLELDFVAVAQ